ncbi:TonB-dependent siderophore receptor [Acinetobacter haemolyticus]|uniref:TonB-dependent siderophore receptor n=1 Tax=Acinetobacter haemolyticus TaxID=29430 RepID=A0AAJ3D8K4_ACIHA|nr:TonB-dependent siderophore receptor [Acinetobacter haemolyticus]NAR17464.1 TonB-dependent siderophore receptor [Acinetobacter haemolyticus]NAR29377.1 TonB-dependent siderophore receptor [Acinetobacter haemolyticus]NAR62865.1 TonB-dependent siderophore receptor [Acinetobacter haemolyticus]NAR72669.1 TonB-dependent siderophore receptor [Acinetobacter haemolyticus]NAR75631.1 TonB-dependent siderophore receptor [Acinetobacter haemolyticus]
MSKKIAGQSLLAISVLSSMMALVHAAETTINENPSTERSQGTNTTKLETIVLTAEEQIKQSLGVSKITAEDLEKIPVRNDISEYVRRMPGVNLTGNSATGQRGNNRQIDIRGMGPENTLILVDGKPISSRNSVRYGWRGERDTRGDSNWVPAEAIESIEVLRGPAAARYGSGAAGGVVNIITKKVTNETHGSIELYTNQPEDSKEGDSNRVSFNLSGPIIQDVLSYRLYGNYNKTKADDVDINKSIGSTAAGREGVENKDISGRLAWQATDAQTILLDLSSGRQGNIYSGDSQLNANAETDPILSELIGKETNTMYRDSLALTHEGNWGWGKTKILAQYDKTRNKRLPEGLAGSVEGKINNLEDRVTSKLDTLRLNGEANIPFDFYLPQALTLGVEWVEDKFTDTAATAQGIDQSGSGYGDQLAKGDRSKMESRIASAYVEDNFKVTDATDVVVGLRFDDHSKSGSNWSPSLNITQKINDNFTLKGGVAKAYKAPNMYQNAEGYLLSTNGNGCPSHIASRCLLQGNGDLKPETSINKELGIEFQKDIVNASLAWFRNDYKNKIVAGTDVVTTVDASTTGENGAVTTTTWNVLRWDNTPKALIQGFEGSLGLDFGDIRWTNNFTYMMDSKDKKTGNPLSLVPNYTINSIFDYDITDQVDVNFVYTQYGRQKSRQFAESRIESGIGSGGANSALKPSIVKSYSLVGLNMGYKFNDQLSTRIGVSNLFDKQILRDSNSTSQTYNEPGRAYYATMKYSF